MRTRLSDSRVGSLTENPCAIVVCHGKPAEFIRRYVAKINIQSAKCS
jgi:hypothetical protein